MADDGIMGMLSGLFGGGGQPDPNAPMQILPQAQQDAAAGPSFLDTLKAGLAKNGPQAFSGLANQMMQKPQAPPPLPPIQFGQVRQPPVYGSMIPPRMGT